jgi:hypothetical protein
MKTVFRYNWRDGCFIEAELENCGVVLARNWRDDGFTYIFRQYSRSKRLYLARAGREKYSIGYVEFALLI